MVVLILDPLWAIFTNIRQPPMADQVQLGFASSGGDFSPSPLAWFDGLIVALNAVLDTARTFWTRLIALLFLGAESAGEIRSAWGWMECMASR